MRIAAGSRGRDVPKLALLALLAVGGFTCGCTGRAAATPGHVPAQTARIDHGQSRTIVGLEIRFQSVASDSRCPKGETCVWEGDATVVVSVRGYGAPAARVELHTSAKGPSEAVHGEWTIRLLSLDPYPVTGHAVDPATYVATIAVARTPGAGSAP
jgi:hypothetical protein